MGRRKGMKALSPPQMELLRDLADFASNYGAGAYAYYPYRKRLTGNVLVERGYAEVKEGTGSPGCQIGYRLTEAGRERFNGNG